MAGNWISVDDYLPEVGKCVIVFSDVWQDRGYMLEGASNNAGEWWGTHWRVGGGHALVTHWMPFPDPPKGGPHGR